MMHEHRSNAESHRTTSTSPLQDRARVAVKPGTDVSSRLPRSIDFQPDRPTVMSQTPRPPIKWAVCPECHQRAGLRLEESPKSVDSYECQECGYVWTVPRGRVRLGQPKSGS
jgi:Zn ribbon nucleic-acid-binding protein